jgi:hypothetical protein
MKQKIRLKWADMYKIMERHDLDEKYKDFTERLEDMWNGEFPNSEIEVKWTD